MIIRKTKEMMGEGLTQEELKLESIKHGLKVEEIANELKILSGRLRGAIENKDENGNMKHNAVSYKKVVNTVDAAVELTQDLVKELKGIEYKIIKLWLEDEDVQGENV